MARKQGSKKPKASNANGPAKSAKAAAAAAESAKSAAQAGSTSRRAVKEQVVEAGLALAAEIPWAEIKLQDIAARAKLPLADVVEVFPTKLSVVCGFMRHIDRKVIENLDPELAGEPARERLFDVLIGRFEALNPYKAGVRSLWQALSRDPDALMVLDSAVVRSQLAMMAAAGLNAEGLSGMARAQGVAMIFFRTMGVWLEDEDPGMARTMAALDRHLRDAERLMRPLQGFGIAARLAGAFCAAFFGRGGDRTRREEAT
ncbi:MAG: TetR/AcrR family transcriptional regulator [Hyphomicrobiales bacterium]|nr:TetR/AcrR family transcriptional regulator [Hyphomicrobiales bacterium]